MLTVCLTSARVEPREEGWYMNKRITSIVITGGPCAGKSSILAHLRQRLSEAGYYIVTVPESAREFRSNGLTPGRIGRQAFQEQLLRFTLERESRYRQAIGHADAEKIILLCDRGALDMRAYTQPHEFFRVLDSLAGMKLPDLREGRYDLIIHLRTAALGAPESYANDTERFETPAEAIALDEQTLNAWTGHPHLAVIDCTPDFAEKKRRACEAIFHFLGIPVPMEIERKYIVAKPDISAFPVAHETILITQTYLICNEPGMECRVREWTQYGGTTYFKTVKRSTGPGVFERVEEEDVITQEEYRILLNYADPHRRRIVKTRTCFVFENQYFELDDLRSVQPDLYLLEVELTDRQQEVTLPPFLEIYRDVTGNPQFSNRELSYIP